MQLSFYRLGNRNTVFNLHKEDIKRNLIPDHIIKVLNLVVAPELGNTFDKRCFDCRQPLENYWWF